MDADLDRGRYWLSNYEKIRDSEIEQAIKKPEKIKAATVLEMLGYMLILTYSNEELNQQIDRLTNKDEALAKFLKTKKLDLDFIRDDIGHKFELHPNLGQGHIGRRF